MTREEFVGQIERGASQASRLPVTHAVLHWLAAELKKGEPAWWKGVAKAWEKRSFVAWNEAWSLLLTAMHFEALNEAKSPLVQYFPSCGGTPDADPSPALAKFMASPGSAFYDNLKNGHRRTFVSARALLWTAPAMLFFQRRKLPYYLVEANAGAGLNLAADQLMPIDVFDSELVNARIGLDPKPLDIDDLLDRRWLTAGIWPDDLDSIATLDAAVERVQELEKEDATFIQLAACPTEKVPAFVAKNVPVDEEAGLLIYNMGTTVRMSESEYAAYSKSMAKALEPWGDRGLWIEVESVRGELYSTTYQLRAHRVIEGELKSIVMLGFDIATGAQQSNEAADQFLGPGLAVEK